MTIVDLETSTKLDASIEGVSVLSTPMGDIQVCASKDAICSVAFIDSENREETKESNVEELPNQISELGKSQLQAYFAGELTDFDLPLAPQGTAFQKSVWQQLLNVPFAHTASYLDIAKLLQNPKACRAVGAANGKNPIAIMIPCHRIIGASGQLTGYAGGLHRKKFLLSLEQSY